MSVIIYTYSNPYRINSEPYWAMIRNSFHLCVSQTLVNGLCDQYADFYVGKLTTVNRFINELFADWESDSLAIRQRAFVDNLIENTDWSALSDEFASINDIQASLKRNRGYLLDSLRIMCELDMPAENIVESELSFDQKCLVALYRELKECNSELFDLKKDFSEEEIDNAIKSTMEDSLRDESKREDLQNIFMDNVVVHGIHQFTPIVLRTIELLGKYKNVIILFNYVQDYKNVYQTWMNVYSWFESKINISEQIFSQDSKKTPGKIVADNVAALISGSTSVIDYSNVIEVTEFNNQTEFAGYIAKKFEQAEKKRSEESFAHPALFYMDEQIYSANSKVNDILKIYFPEQFGERNFLDYPIGHFFVSITNMWDSESGSMLISDISDVVECLSCGIIYEKRSGMMASLLEKCKLYVSNETTINGIIKRLRKLNRNIDSIDEQIARIEYFNITLEEINELINALTDLNAIAEEFFSDFSIHGNDFRKFYKKITDVLVEKVLDKEDLNEDFRDIVERVLERLNGIKDLQANASFDCLRETMQIYLQQIPKEGRGANWIVRNFEQIDGDVLRKIKNENEKIYHFACLSDDDMSITHKDEFPWPLNVSFFEIAQAPVDWKYQVFVTSRKEYKNFRRYALIYGMSFSKHKIKLSYIKNENDKNQELYYLLRVLNAKVVPYTLDDPDSYRKDSGYINIEHPISCSYTKYDLVRYRLCNYRFLLESIIDSKTVYKDPFLLKNYLTILLENRARMKFSGKDYNSHTVRNYLEGEMDDLIDYFPFVTHAEEIDILSTVEAYLSRNAVYRGKFNVIKENEIDYMLKRELFLTVLSNRDLEDEMNNPFRNSTQLEVDNELKSENLSKCKYYRTLNSLCEKCADKDICLEIYKSKKKR